VRITKRPVVAPTRLARTGSNVAGPALSLALALLVAGGAALVAANALTRPTPARAAAPRRRGGAHRR
jgi:hypothetical protein